MISRHVNLLKLLEKTSSAFLLGPRGTGKTYLSESWIKNQEKSITYNLLDSREYSRLIKTPEILIDDIESILARNPKVVVSVLIDEVQKLPVLLDHVHLLLEKHKKKVRFLLTGSSARKLKSSGANLLAGRAYNIKLHPFTYDEIEAFSKKFNLVETLKRGAIPSILASENPEMALRAYVETYLKEEIQQEALVRKLDKFFKFLDLAAQLNGEPVNFSKFARQIGVADKTVADYFQILIDTLLVTPLPGWDRSIKKQILKLPKFYFFDCGVLNSAAHELNQNLSPGTPKFGRLFEQFVINEFVKFNDYLFQDYSFYYYSNGKSEVDLVLSRGLKKPPIGIEIKSSDYVSAKDLKGLGVFSTEYPNAQLYCVCLTTKSYEVTLENKQKVRVLSFQEALKELFQLQKN